MPQPYCWWGRVQPLVGPGAAKFDLQERLVAHGLGDLIIGVESTEAMTDCQLVMAVRQYFHEAAVMI